MVEGARCEKCKNGYFNLTKENSEGCERKFKNFIFLVQFNLKLKKKIKACSCNLIGTSGNLGCDKVTGLCSCKAYVTGRACDQCLVKKKKIFFHQFLIIIYYLIAWLFWSNYG